MNNSRSNRLTIILILAVGILMLATLPSGVHAEWDTSLSSVSPTDLYIPITGSTATATYTLIQQNDFNNLDVILSTNVFVNGAPDSGHITATLSSTDSQFSQCGAGKWCLHFDPCSSCRITKQVDLIVTVLTPTDGVYEIDLQVNHSGNIWSPSNLIVHAHVTDFSLTASSPVSTDAGSRTTSTITATAKSGFTGIVVLTDNAGTACYLNYGTITLSISSGSGSDTLTCSSTSAQDLIVTVTGMSGSLQHNVTPKFPFVDFAITPSAPITLTVDSGDTATQIISIQPLNSFPNDVSLTASPSSGLSFTCQPMMSVVGGSGTSALSCLANAPGDFTILVTGVSGSLIHTSASITFHVVDMTVSVGSFTPSPILPGVKANSTVSIKAMNGFAGTVTLTVYPSIGLECSLNPTSVMVSLAADTTTSSLSCTANDPRNYYYNVAGTSGSLVRHTPNNSFDVVDFSAAASSSTIVVSTGAPGVSDIVLTAINGFTGTLNLSQNGGTLCSLNATTITITATMSPKVAALTCGYANAGSSTVTVTVTMSSTTHTVAVVFQSVDYAISTNPTNVSLNVNQRGSSTVTVTAVNGFTGTISLSQNAGTSCTLSPTSIVLTATITSGTAVLNCSFTSYGIFQVIVTETSSSLSIPTTITFTARDVPGPPQNVQTTPGIGKITLSWRAPSSEGGSPLIGYKIYRGTSGSNLTFLIQESNDTFAFIDTGLDSGKTYTYQVSAINSVGESLRGPPTLSPTAPLPPPITPFQVPWLPIGIAVAIGSGFGATLVVARRKRKLSA